MYCQPRAPVTPSPRSLRKWEVGRLPFARRGSCQRLPRQHGVSLAPCEKRQLVLTSSDGRPPWVPGRPSDSGFRPRSRASPSAGLEISRRNLPWEERAQAQRAGCPQPRTGRGGAGPAGPFLLLLKTPTHTRSGPAGPQACCHFPADRQVPPTHPGPLLSAHVLVGAAAHPETAA